MSSSGMATTSKVEPNEIGWMFVPQYYTFVNKHPQKLHCFYTKKSTFIHATEGEESQPRYGQQEIHDRIMSLDFQDCRVYVSNVDSQSSAEGGIIIQVLGEISNKQQAWRKFAQTFFLAEQPNGYFVLNDIFRYLKEDSDESHEEVASEAEGLSASGGGQTLGLGMDSSITAVAPGASPFNQQQQHHQQVNRDAFGLPTSPVAPQFSSAASARSPTYQTTFGTPPQPQPPTQQQKPNGLPSQQLNGMLSSSQDQSALDSASTSSVASPRPAPATASPQLASRHPIPVPAPVAMSEVPSTAASVSSKKEDSSLAPPVSSSSPQSNSSRRPSAAADSNAAPRATTPVPASIKQSTESTISSNRPPAEPEPAKPVNPAGNESKLVAPVTTSSSTTPSDIPTQPSTASHSVAPSVVSDRGLDSEVVPPSSTASVTGQPTAPQQQQQQSATPTPAPPAVKTWANLAAANSSKKWSAAVTSAPPAASTSSASSATSASGAAASRASTATGAANSGSNANQQSNVNRPPAPAFTPGINPNNVNSPNCFVKGVMPSIDEREFRDILVRKFGPVRELEIPKTLPGAGGASLEKAKGGGPGQPGCAFLEFASVDSARRAIQHCLPTYAGGEGGLYLPRSNLTVLIEPKRAKGGGSGAVGTTTGSASSSGPRQQQVSSSGGSGSTKQTTASGSVKNEGNAASTAATAGSGATPGTHKKKGSKSSKQGTGAAGTPAAK